MRIVWIVIVLLYKLNIFIVGNGNNNEHDRVMLEYLSFRCVSYNFYIFRVSGGRESLMQS